MRNNDPSRAMRALGSHSVLQPSEKMMQLLQELHPPEDPLELPGSYTTKALQVSSQQEIRSILSKLKFTTAAGPDGLRPGYFKVLSRCIGSRSVLLSLRGVINRLLRANVPAEV